MLLHLYLYSCSYLYLFVKSSYYILILVLGPQAVSMLGFYFWCLHSVWRQKACRSRAGVCSLGAEEWPWAAGGLGHDAAAQVWGAWVGVAGACLRGAILGKVIRFFFSEAAKLTEGSNFNAKGETIHDFKKSRRNWNGSWHPASFSFSVTSLLRKTSGAEGGLPASPSAVCPMGHELCGWPPAPSCICSALAACRDCPSHPLPREDKSKDGDLCSYLSHLN